MADDRRPPTENPWRLAAPGSPDCDHYLETRFDGTVLVRECRDCDYRIENAGQPVDEQRRVH